MRSFAPLLSLLSLALLSAAAPTPPLDTAALLANAKEAQSLNSQFAQLKATDSCNNGDSACVDGALATCDNGAWKLDQCPQPSSCFALPSVRRDGTFLVCTMQNIVEALISSLGAEGGVTGNGDPGTGSGATATVTVTVTLSDLAATPTVTLDPVTETLDPSAAASALGGVNVAPTITLNGPAPTASSTPPPAASPSLAANVGQAPGAPTTIFLNNPAQTDAPATSAAAVDPAPAAAPTTDSGSSGGYGYGGY